MTNDIYNMKFMYKVSFIIILKYIFNLAANNKINP